MNIPREDVERLAALGYTEREAVFLYIVATHSGYFTLRQFDAFVGVPGAKRSKPFAQKLLKRGHASMRDYMGTGSVFHLSSTRIYEPIENENFGMSYRLRHSFDYTRTRLVLLDFLLENQQYDFFESDTDKVRLFCESLGISKDVLPMRVFNGGPGGGRRVRYFVDRFPLFLAPAVPGAAPVVTFSFVDSGAPCSSRFLAHLAAYEELFRAMNSFRLLYIAPRTTEFRRAENRFRTKFDSDLTGDILRYFEIRRKWENHEYIVPVTADFAFLGKARRLFRGDRVETFYQAWIAGRIAEPELRREFALSLPERTLFFDTYLVRNDHSPLDERYRPGRREKVYARDAPS
jgi:hypothetical protein